MAKMARATLPSRFLGLMIGNAQIAADPEPYIFALPRMVNAVGAMGPSLISPACTPPRTSTIKTAMAREAAAKAEEKTAAKEREEKVVMKVLQQKKVRELHEDRDEAANQREIKRLEAEKKEEQWGQDIAEEGAGNNDEVIDVDKVNDELEEKKK